MTSLWAKEGLDLRMCVYDCLATSSSEGMLEVVKDAWTVADIQRTAGAFGRGAFDEKVIHNWLESQISETLTLDPNSTISFPFVQENFVRSCAAYVVATYVMQIGDRHPSNIMLQKYGRLFHIDFGHILGNYKKFAGVDRERAPFVFTAEYAFVMGGKDSPTYNYFVDLCCKAFLVIRKHASSLLSMFLLMVSTGMPELQCAADIDPFRDKLILAKDDREAERIFRDLIEESLLSFGTKLNNAAHIFVHDIKG